MAARKEGFCAMRFDVERISPVADRVVLDGRLDSVTVGQVETQFTAVLANTGRHAVLDMRRLDFLSSLGIRLLISVTRVITRRGGRVVAFGAQPMVAEVLDAMALDDILPLVGSETEAMARLAA
jgi:anti-sigma B factor antagonist